MINNLKYTVRSREIIDLMAALRAKSLILSPYFQRNLVWREGHKKDFIDTILSGYPFPQIFLARGPIDVETMMASTCVVDGQQRLTSIKEFMTDKFDVKGRKFSDLTVEEKTEFLKYEVAVIDFDLDVSDDRLKEIFQRLNRTYYALSGIEKVASEFSSSQFLIVARVLSEIENGERADIVFDDLFNDELNENKENSSNLQNNLFLVDPAINKNVQTWMSENSNGIFARLITSNGIFTSYEFSRKVPLMFVLNVMSTYHNGYYNRNSKVKDMLEQYNENYDSSAEILDKLNRTAQYILELNLPNSSIWFNKANFFTLVVELLKILESLLQPEEVRQALLDFEANVPRDYQLAAREAVNSRSERLKRAEYVQRLIRPKDDSSPIGQV